MMYFPNFKPSQFPEKEFMYGILSTLKPDEVKQLVAQSLKDRAPKSQDEKDDFVEVTKELYNSIQDLYFMKSKRVLKAYMNFCIATKGRTNYLLKESSILSAPRKSRKKYQADLTVFANYKAETRNRVEIKGNDEEENKDGMK